MRGYVYPSAILGFDDQGHTFLVDTNNPGSFLFAVLNVLDFFVCKSKLVNILIEVLGVWLTKAWEAKRCA